MKSYGTKNEAIHGSTADSRRAARAVREASSWPRVRWVAVAVIICFGFGTGAAQDKSSIPTLRYVGSSTIANFIRDAGGLYRRVRFVLDTAPESAGGELALLEGRADLAGVAGLPRAKSLKQGIQATLIGRDAIAVVVNLSNPLGSLDRGKLRNVFTGKVANWKELGGPDLPLHCYIVSPASATRNVFRSSILGVADYAGCRVIRPDEDILKRVEADPSGVGQISFSFLRYPSRVKALVVDGQHPVPGNPDYPISRSLYLLWWPGRVPVATFIAWTQTPEARELLLKRFALPTEQQHRAGLKESR